MFMGGYCALLIAKKEILHVANCMYCADEIYYYYTIMKKIRHAHKDEGKDLCAGQTIDPTPFKCNYIPLCDSHTSDMFSINTTTVIVSGIWNVYETLLRYSST